MFFRHIMMIVGMALRSTQVQLPISRFLFLFDKETMTMTMTTLLALGFLGYKSLKPATLVKGIFLMSNQNQKQKTDQGTSLFFSKSPS